MKTTQVIGLFLNSDRTGKILNSLVIAGLHPQTMFSQAINENVYAVSVYVKDAYEYRMVKNIFQFYKMAKYFVTENVEPEGLKAFLTSHSRAEVFTPMEIRKRNQHKGINSEVQFG